MKHFVIVVVLVITIHSASASWFRSDVEVQRRKQAEQKLVEQQRTTNRWEGMAFLLGLGCVISLVSGAAIGSNGRKCAGPPK